jgi:hypothetical protein
MVHIHSVEDHVLDILDSLVSRGALHASPHGKVPPPPPPPPVGIEKLLATQNYLMRRLVKNGRCRGTKWLPFCHQQAMDSYAEFLVTHLPLFSELTNLLEVDNWLCATESKFGLHRPAASKVCGSLVDHLHPRSPE